MPRRVNTPVAPAEEPTTWRQQQAAATKDRIAESARRLFADHGYAATSIDAIATEAGVAVRTVYAAFGTKREILSHICGAWLERAGAREGAERVLAEPDAVTRLTAATHWLTHLYAAGFDVVEILESATDDSAETRELLRAKLAGRDHVMGEMIRSLEPHLSVPLAEAQAVFRGLAAPPLYRELVVGAGWSPERLGDWLAGILRSHVLADETPASRRRRKE
jgi:AcrR family transcriptional regulator